MRRSDATVETHYLVKDHLGSVDAILDAAGVVQVRTSFNAFGARRDDDWVGLPSTAEYTAIAGSSRRGFTSHEMLDNVGLVHMNGRVYDPAVGRFISADPYLDEQFGTQGANRYAYVGGRCVSFADPSGFEGMDAVVALINGVETVVVEATRIRHPGFSSFGGGVSGIGSVGDAGGGKGSRGRIKSDAAEPANGDCFNVVFSLSGTVATGAGAAEGGGGGLGFGLSYGGNILDARLFLSVQAFSFDGGAGLYAVIGGSTAAGWGSVPLGPTTMTGSHFEAGFGGRGGGSATLDVFRGSTSPGGYHSKMPGGRIGWAVGGFVGSGTTTATTVGAPSLRDVSNWIAELLDLPPSDPLDCRQ